MDNQYHSTAFLPMANPPQHGQHYQPYNGISQQQQQQQHQPPTTSSSENPTLPPLQPSSNNYSHLPSIYSNQHHAASPHTSHTPTSSTAPTWSPMPNPATTGSMPPPSSYVPIGANYTSSQNGHPASTMPTSSSMTSTMGASRLPDLRPAPQTNNYGTTPFPNFGPSNGMTQGNQYLQSQEQEPTHVVGSQGRRGILPSAPGRAAPPTPGTAAATKSLIPAKDADGKFPCPHCNKTYLHAKHLKRHLLRHTGDRPYMCHLCKDTFSRSDILKRHFQKCSIRRGNPTGANHLAHQRRNTNPSNRMSMGNEPIGLAGLANVAGAPAAAYANGDLVNASSSSPTVNGDQSSYASSVASISNRSSRANSLIHPPGMHHDARNGVSGLGLSSMTNSSNGEPVQSTTAPYGSTMPAYAMRPHSSSNPMPPNYGYASGMPNGMPYSSLKAEDQNGHYASHGGQMQHSWNMYGQDGFMGQQQQQQQHEQPHAPQQQQHHHHHHNMPVKAEHGGEGQNYASADGHNEPFMGGMYSHASNPYGDENAPQNQQ